MVRDKKKCKLKHIGGTQGEGGPGVHTQIFTTSGSSLRLFSYNVVNASQLLTKMIVLAKLPFVFAENEFFEEFLQPAPCPQF